MANKRLLTRLFRSLSPEASTLLLRAIEIAGARRDSLYLVGGGVRDLLLGATHFDVDLVVEGDAIGLARALAKQLDAYAVAHSRFGTAVVRRNGFRLDFARARSERYSRPGALPAVEPASIMDDLARRDFTINAIALRLSEPDPGALLDPFGGRDDLDRRRIRVLLDRSFSDDATRILRGVRYSGRLDFRIEAHTARLLRRDMACLSTISGARLRREFERIADEARARAIVRLAHRLGVLRAVHPALTVDDRIPRAAGRLAQVPPARRAAVLFALLLSRATPASADAAIARLALTGEQSSAVRGMLALRRQRLQLGRAALRPSAAVQIFGAHSIAAIEAFALITDRLLAARRARRYLEHWRHTRPRLDGHAIVALGVPRGPLVGETLACLRDARLDGKVNTRYGEELLVRTKFVERPSEAGGRRRHG